MKLLVCISKTPETTSTIKFVDGGKALDTDGLKYIMNPYDEWYALVRALELKEAVGGTVTVVNVGSSENDTVIRKALAIVADDATRINGEPTSAIATARMIADFAKDQGFDAIFCGKETIDYNSAEVPAMLAELLDLPYIPLAKGMEVDGRSAKVVRDIEGGSETVQLDFPFVLSASKGLAEQRIPNMRGIMMAKRKALNVVEPNTTNDQAVISGYELPSDKQGVKLIDPDNVEELVRLLKEEAKAI